MTDQPEKMPLSSMDIAAEKRDALKQLFPEVFAEDRIDFDQLKRALGEWVEPGKERFGLTWPGKADCMRIIQSPSVATLKPVREESVNFDETDNVFIEGDNLEVLKLLQKAYFGKVKMIYIDPPYNTGGEFIYPDKFAETLDTYLAYTSQIDDEGRKFSTNTDSGGRYHSKWLSMMYPRLYLARNLLREDGVFFMTIGDDEVPHATQLLNSIFGEENFIGTIIWEKIYTTKNDSNLLSNSHDYILMYCKEKSRCKLGSLPRTKEMDARYTNPDNDPRGPWKAIPLYAAGERTNGRFKVISPSGLEYEPPTESHWRYSKADVEALQKDNRIYFGRDGTGQPNIKRFLSELDEGVKSKTIWFHKEVGSNDSANREIKELFDGKEKVFSFPKPSSLVRRMIQLGAPGSNDLVLDFFAGSSSTAHAVLASNKDEEKSRKFIMVQLPEPTENSSFDNIAEISRDRIRRVLQRIKGSANEELSFSEEPLIDFGFRCFSLRRSSFKLWQGHVESLSKELDLHVQNVDASATPEDIVYELLLKAGFPLTTKVKPEEMAGKTVYSVEDGALLICLDKEITSELLDALAEADPLQVICLDEGFRGNDQLKANAVQTFKARAASRETEIVFRTV